MSRQIAASAFKTQQFRANEPGKPAYVWCVRKLGHREAAGRVDMTSSNRRPRWAVTMITERCDEEPHDVRYYHGNHEDRRDDARIIAHRAGYLGDRRLDVGRHRRAGVDRH